jgi:hypothetical protein
LPSIRHSLSASSSIHRTPSRRLNLTLPLFAPRLAAVDEAVAVDVGHRREPRANPSPCMQRLHSLRSSRTPPPPIPSFA